MTKTSLHGYILHMEEQGKAATTISRMMAAMKAFLIMNVCRHASGGTRRKVCMRRKWRKGAGDPGVDQVSALLAQPSGQTPKEIGTRRCWLFICDRNPGVKAYRDPDGRYQYEHWISGLSRRGGERTIPRLDVRRKQRWRSIWNMRETSCCVERIGLFLCQLYGRRDEPAGILEDYQILRRESRD